MDTKSLLDEILKTGKDLAAKGQTIAEEKLQIPQAGDQRDATMDGIKKGAIAVGVLALLLGTGAGRRVTGSALKIGSLAAIGGIGWKAYQNWQQQNEDQAAQEVAERELIPINELPEKEANERSLILLKAMIAAAKADGHVNKKEIEIIHEQIDRLGLSKEISNLVENEISKPLDIKEVAALAKNKSMASEIYLVSAIVTDKENSMERDYLASLASSMQLPSSLVAELDSAKDSDTA
ncbi:MAG TPA: tellurite resistance TerB family protein [Leucothrix mucor]|nr:tellurite resistance TerB family protein [Leucothrix mucor]